MLQVNLGFEWRPSEGRSGCWEEVYYITGDTIADGVSKLWETSGILGRSRTSMIGRRLQCLADDCFLYFVRVAVVGSRGNAQVFQQNQAGYASGSAAIAEEEAEYAGTAVVQRVTGNVSAAVRRYVRLGGIPDSVLKGGKINPGWYSGQVWNGAADQTTFLGKWRAGGLSIRYRVAALGGGSSFQIRSASKDGQYGLITLQTSRNAAFDQAVPVVISCRSQPQVRGNWRVQYTGVAGECRLAGSERVSCPETLTGYVTLGGVDFQSMGDVFDPFLSGHKLGKKKYGRHGRQSPKLLRH